MIDEGTTAPEFALPGTSVDRDDPRVSQYELEDALRRGPVIVNFYLFDFHPECTEHLCGLHDLGWFDLEGTVTAFGISTDRSFSHRAFAESEGLSFALLSDSDGSVADAYDVLYDEFNGHKQIAKRSVFLIDEDRVVRYAWSTEDPTVQPDWPALKEAYEELETGRGAPRGTTGR